MSDAPLLEWLAMGGYAWFVWPAYALGLIVLVANLCLPLTRHRRLVREGSAREGAARGRAARAR